MIATCRRSRRQGAEPGLRRSDAFLLAPPATPTTVAPRPLQTATLTVLAMVAFAANSLLTRLALDSGTIDAASFTCIRLAAGAATLIALTGRRLHRRGNDRGWNPLIEGDDDGVVGVDEARLDGAAEMVLVDCIHTFLMESEETIAATVRFLTGESETP